MDPPTDKRPDKATVSSVAAASAWSAMRYPVFRYLWIATVASNVGGWMYSAASGWLMTNLDDNPLVVSLVQVANSLPLFVLALPAGALADMIDKRRFILALEILTTIFTALFALAVSLKVITPAVLLLFILLIGALGALETPAWQAIVPLLVPRPALSSAVAVNSLGVNISRVIGPAFAGAIILGFGIAAPFWLDAVSNLGVIAIIFWWKPATRGANALPAERLVSAMRVGVRYARNNLHLRATLAQAVGFFLFASAYWALLPLLARNQLHGGPTLYGVLLGAIGASGVAGAILLPKLKAKAKANTVVAIGELGTGIALALFGVANQEWLAVLACVIAGASWIIVLATLNVSAQAALPEWVRGRGLAAYVTVFFGTMSLGSALWGWIAERFGLAPAHFIAAAGALAAIALSRRWRLQTGPAADLTPSMHWPEPVVHGAVSNDSGPVLVTVEYHVATENGPAFLAALAAVARERKRDGAYSWGIFKDTAHETRYVETFLLDSWLEHVRQHHRVTSADRVTEAKLLSLTLGKPLITHYIASEVPAK
jgi:MFS family permease